MILHHPSPPPLAVSFSRSGYSPKAKCNAREDEAVTEERVNLEGYHLGLSYSLPEDLSLQQNHLPSEQIINSTRKKGKFI